MSQWFRIDERKPEQDESVYYWFGVWDQVYEGFFKEVEEEYDDDQFFTSNVFYSKHGFLGDDVTWWMPRCDLPMFSFYPSGPTDEQKSQCKYHPVEPGYISPHLRSQLKMLT